MTTNKFKKTGIVLSVALGIILATAAICLTISVIWPVNDLKLASLISGNWLMTILYCSPKDNLIN